MPSIVYNLWQPAPGPSQNAQQAFLKELYPSMIADSSFKEQIWREYLSSFPEEFQKAIYLIY
jgi:hypothetical protein